MQYFIKFDIKFLSYDLFCTENFRCPSPFNNNLMEFNFKHFPIIIFQLNVWSFNLLVNFKDLANYTKNLKLFEIMTLRAV